MIASPFLERGVRAFFTDMLGLDDFDHLEKDSVIYPDFTLEVARDAREQILRNIVGLLVTDDGDYRDLFTTRRTYLSGPLGRFYGVPVPRPDGGWYPYEFPDGDPRAGLITQVGFTALHSHPGRSSPTIRGRAIREQLLCQKVPDPPGDVDFSRFNDPNSPNKTARERLTVHATDPVCAGCHKLTDPIGLGLEKIDGAGQLRENENGEPILTAGQLDGRDYADAVGLGHALHDDPAAPSCVVRRLYSYATGHAVGPGDRDVIKYFDSGFSRDGYRIPRLLRRIATSEAFYAVSQPTPAQTVARNGASPGPKETTL
jgi:hypothetical protein